MNVEDEVRGVLANVLQLGTRASGLNLSSTLLGTLPELDSMAVVAVVTALEDRFGIQFDDDEISADTFATFGSLCDLVKAKT